MLRAYPLKPTKSSTTSARTPGDPNNPYYNAISQGRHGYLYTAKDDFYSDGIGNAFYLTTNGKLTVLHGFNGADGQSPIGGLTLGHDGFYYGATAFGGNDGFGTVFNMRADNGGIGTLHSDLPPGLVHVRIRQI